MGFITKERAGGLDGVDFNVAPDLAVEVVSEDEDIYKKAREYLTAGAKMVWAIYPDDQEVHIFTLDADGSIHAQPFGIETTLSGGEVLPGFTLAVRDIFPE